MGIIYEIICWTTGLRYIGQTTQTLKKRMVSHKNHFKKKKRFCSSTLVLEHGNYESYELERIEDKNKLIEREKYYIQHTNCVNINGFGFDRKEYNEANKEIHLKYAKEYRDTNNETISEKKKEYYKANKEKILEKVKEKYTCECGSVLTKQHKSRHEKSKVHQDYLKKKIDF